MNIPETPAFRRGIAALSGFLFCGYAIWGVAVERRVGADHIGVHVPAWWYLIAAGPPLFAFVIALVFPTHHRCWQRGLVSNLLIFLSISSLLASTSIYAIYDFEHPRRPTPTATSR